jgi:translation initiation factor 3 subunit D
LLNLANQTQQTTQQTGRQTRQRGQATNPRNQPGKRRGQYDQKPRLRDASINIKPDWKILEEIDFPRLNKMQFEFPTDIQDVAACGSLHYYDKTFDRLTTKAPKALPDSEVAPGLTVTASKDPILQKLAKETQGKSVFITDTVLSALMCATRSIYPWDIILTKQNGQIWMDKRPDATLDIITVNENAAESHQPPETSEKETGSTAATLAEEATNINRNFIAAVTKEDETFTFKEENAYGAGLAYKYRKLSLGEDVDLFVRCTMDAAIQAPGGTPASLENAVSPILAAKKSTFSPKETLYASVKALLEYDPKPIPGQEWRKRLDAQRGAIVATEIKNNGNRLARWTLEAIFGGADQMRLGFVSRANPKVAKNHQVLAVIAYKPREFASQMNLNLNATWGIVKAITSHVFTLEDGKYGTFLRG